MRIAILLILGTICHINLPAQSESALPAFAIGEWRQHLPWQRSVYVTQSPENIYYATEWAIAEISKSDRSVRFITKVEGLSDVGINLVRYCPAAEALVISYTNNNLDLYFPADRSVLNLPFIQKNPNVIGDKKIYDVFFDGSDAYFACGFGMLKFDVEAAEAKYTVFTGMAVKSVAVAETGYGWQPMTVCSVCLKTMTTPLILVAGRLWAVRRDSRLVCR